MKILCLVILILCAQAWAGEDCRGGLRGNVVEFPIRSPKIDHDTARIKRLMTLLHALDETAATDPIVALQWSKAQVEATLQTLQLSQDQMEAYFELYEGQHTPLVEHYLQTMQALYASPILRRLHDMYAHYEIVQARAQLDRVASLVFRRDDLDFSMLAANLDMLLYRISEFRKEYEFHPDAAGEAFIGEFSGRLFANHDVKSIMNLRSEESAEVRARLTRLRVISGHLRLRLERAARHGT